MTYINNGNYEITTYSFNGQSQTEFLGEYAVINANTLTDWTNNTATLQGSRVTVIWQGTVTMVKQGIISNNQITVEQDIEGNHYIMVLTYRS